MISGETADDWLKWYPREHFLVIRYCKSGRLGFWHAGRLAVGCSGYGMRERQRENLWALGDWFCSFGGVLLLFGGFTLLRAFTFLGLSLCLLGTIR